MYLSGQSRITKATTPASKLKIVEKMVQKADILLAGSLDRLKLSERSVEMASRDLHAKRIVLEKVKEMEAQHQEVDQQLALFNMKEAEVIRRMNEEKKNLAQQKVKFSSNSPGFFLMPPLAKKRKYEEGPIIQEVGDDDEDDDDDEMADFIDIVGEPEKKQ
jgi:hypothetical protein